ncbi:hypothetical protein BV898_08113 [Hypsibius exemplaris]|uniref:Uncharacterized protein n=1 Tax=Hypsibius exemplaris TaxID=2072580 RepID=A0A1W0WRM7_HYPEX|nr:hypothetical protein BV898_08113 [Hypsibius exemplaris]
MPAERISNEISVLDSGSGRASVKTVRVRSGRPDHRTDIEVTVGESKARLRRRRRERRGNRWTRGKIDIHFRALEAQRERQPRTGTIMLSEGGAPSGEVQRERIRGRLTSEKHQRIQRTVKGIPFNYFNTVNRLFSRLSVPSQRPYTDYTVSALALSDNGNRIPLSVMGISTALLDLGYSQKDFVVGAKAVFCGDEIIVEPTRSDEQRVNLESLEAGQGILMVEYLALTNRVAHVFTKGQISATNHKKGLAMCMVVCKDLAESTIALLRAKYDRTMRQASVAPSAALKKTTNPAVAVAHPQAETLKSSFSSMLSTTGTGLAQLTSLAPATSKSAPPAKAAETKTAPKIPLAGGGKKLTLAELAKGKKG